MSTTDQAPAGLSYALLTSRQSWIDLALVVGVCAYFPLCVSTHSVIYGINAHAGEHSNYGAFINILYELAGLAVLAYVLGRRHLKLSYWGHHPEGRDIIRTILLRAAQWIAGMFLYYVFEYGSLAVAGHYVRPASVTKMIGMHVSLTWLIFLIINPWFEELIFRGYLMTELSKLTSVSVAIVASTLVQTSYHLYQGWANVLMLAGVFFVSSVYYARTRRLFPVILAHMIADLLPFARLALFR